MSDREIYLEITQLGNAMRVAAVCSATGEEVVFQAPIKTPRSEINRLAMSKLSWKLRQGSSDAPNPAQKKRPGKKPGRGIKI